MPTDNEKKKTRGPYRSGIRRNTEKSKAALEEAIKTLAYESRDGWATLTIGRQSGAKLVQVVAVGGEVVMQIGADKLKIDHGRL